MPTKRRRRMRGYTEPVSPVMRFWLMTGRRPSREEADYGRLGVLELYMTSDFRPHWERTRDELLDAWIREHPGTRPAAWWLYDAPKPRRDIETEAAYLRRHGLLSADERSRLTPEAFEPEVLEDADDVYSGQRSSA